MAGKVGRPKNKRPAERAIRALKVQEVIDLSENKLIDVLKGNTKLPEKMVVQVALELYKRRIPTKTESEAQGNKLTVIKIVKNHLPNKSTQQSETIDIDSAVDAVLKEKDIDE